MLRLSHTPSLVTLALASLVAGCVSNHRVSPFPPIESVYDILPEPNLDAQVARIDAEAEANRYRLVVERRGKLPEGGEIMVRGYETVDPFGRPSHLVRVATPSGVVLALGPPDPKLIVAPATELRASLLTGGWFSGTDLNGDGAPDVIVQDGRGVLSAWKVEHYGATPLPIQLAYPPTFALDVNGDGHPDFAGKPETQGDDELSPALVDVAVFDGSRYTNTHPEARDWHRRERDRADAVISEALDGEEEETPKEPKEVLTAALERGFHAIFAGENLDATLKELDSVAKKLGPVSSEAQASFARLRTIIADEGRRLAPSKKRDEAQPGG